MLSIYKYPVDDQVVLPEGAEILHIGEQDGQLMFWAQVDLDRDMETRHFKVVGTGWELKDGSLDNCTYLGTTLGIFVWHVFEVKI